MQSVVVVETVRDLDRLTVTNQPVGPFSSLPVGQTGRAGGGEAQQASKPIWRSAVWKGRTCCRSLSTGERVGHTSP